MKVIFLGGKKIGALCLAELRKREFFTICDALYEPKGNINAMESLFRSYEPDYIFNIFSTQILKKNILDICPCKNLHFSLLPLHRGRYSTMWSILHDERWTGVTLHYMDEGIDTGDIIIQFLVEINTNDTAKSLYDKCTQMGVNAIKLFLDKLSNGEEIPRIKQSYSLLPNYQKAMYFPPYEKPLL
jgi:methionyl-tRNA formyltransferase